MFQQTRLNVRRWSSHCMEIWHSALSWMHLRLTRGRRRQELLERLLVNQARMLEQQAAQLLMLQELLLQQVTKQELMEAFRPVAAAMLRQDSLHNQRQEETKDLLLEVLNSLQPPVQEQIFRQIGPPPLRNSFPHSVS